ncbi:MAG: hypothetical protein AAF739_00285 [Pseudomonadota bacterium]
MLNALRGEGRVEINGQAYELVIDMDALARVSASVSSLTLGDAVSAIIGAEPRAMLAVLQSPANKDLREAVTSGLHLFAIGQGAQAAIAELMGPVEGKPAADQTKA